MFFYKLVCSFFILALNLEASTMTVLPEYPVEERKAATTNASSDQILDLISQFSEVNLREEEDKIKTRLTEAVKELTAMKEAFSGIDTDSLVKSEEKVAASLLSHLRSPTGIYDNPPYYPVNIKGLGSLKSAKFIAQAYITTPWEKMVETFTSNGVIPLRSFDPTRHSLVLGCGNYPTDVSGVSNSKKHYKRDAHPDADTVDISASMNPTMVANSYSIGIYDYIRSAGKMYQMIRVEAGPSLTGPWIETIKGILEIGGEYWAGCCDFSITVLPESLKDSAPYKYIVGKDLWVILTMEDSIYERLKAMSAEEYSPCLTGAVGEFYATRGFDVIKMPRMLEITDSGIESKDLAMSFDFIPNKDELGGGRIILKRVS